MIHVKYFFYSIGFVLLISLLLQSCKSGQRNILPSYFTYESFKDSINSLNDTLKQDTTNVFDDNIFIPGSDPLDSLLMKYDTLWNKELAEFAPSDTLNAEKYILQLNVNELDSFLNSRKISKSSTCKKSECLLFAEILKSRQVLNLYIDGELADSFKVSTGIRGFETPNLNTRPVGPLFKKYTSKKFPGGNYQGLGNMPYAVFVKGGYAIHGTTPGNFPKLGRRASHGCIRLHPDNAKIFYELVKRIGIENTWVTVKN